MKCIKCKVHGWACLLFISILVSACSSKAKKDENKDEKFQVTNPVLSDTTYTKEYVAEIQSVQNVEIRTRINGIIEKVHVDEGQAVRKGQTLFTISSRGYQQELLKAKAVKKTALTELKSAEIELENAQKLLDKKIIGKPEYDLALAKVETLKAKIEEAQSDEAQANLNLSYAEIKAPFDGIINRIPHKTGSLIEEETLLTTLSNNREVFAYFNVSEKDYLDYASSKGKGNSKEVSLVLANGAMYNYNGIIETTESEFDKSTGNIAFRAKFPNPENFLKHGGSGKVLVKTELKNAMLIPQKSTFEIQGNIYVFVVNADSTVQQRQIKPTARLSQLYVIEPALQTSDRIIYEGIQKVKDGDKVQTETVSFSKISNSKN
jgi:membrane fusion protein (multidrug efflux system)